MSDIPLTYSDIQCSECFEYFRLDGDLIDHRAQVHRSEGREFAQCSTCQGGPVCYCTDTGFPTTPQPEGRESVHHTDRDANGIDHLVHSRTGRCMTFRECGHSPEGRESGDA